MKQLALYVGPNGATRVVPLRDPQAAVPEFTTEAGRVFRLSMIHHAFDLSPREIREAHERTERENMALAMRGAA